MTSPEPTPLEAVKQIADHLRAIADLIESLPDSPEGE